VPATPIHLLELKGVGQEPRTFLTETGRVLSAEYAVLRSTARINILPCSVCDVTHIRPVHQEGVHQIRT
jgi:hypothetical protein